MLVYLDSGDLANLQRLSVGDASVGTLLDEWAALGCRLALTLHHAQEISQLRDTESIKSRLAFLASFGAADVAEEGESSVVGKEIKVQLLSMAADRPADYQRNLRKLLFHPTSGEAFASYVLEGRTAFSKMREPLDLTAAAKNLSRSAGRPTSSFRRAPIQNLDLDKIREMMMQFGGNDLPSSARDLYLQVVSLVCDSIAREGSLRRGMEAALGVQGYDCIESVPDEDLSSVGTFFHAAREASSEIAASLNVPSEWISELVPQLRPYDCPAWSLTVALSRAQDRSGQSARASDETDRSHIVYAPYVDLAFVDRRTFSFLNEEARDRPERLPRMRISNIARSGDPTHLLREIKRTASSEASHRTTNE